MLDPVPAWTDHALDRLAHRCPGASAVRVADRSTAISYSDAARLLGRAEHDKTYRLDPDTGLVLVCRPAEYGPPRPVVVTVLRAKVPVTPSEASHDGSGH